MESRSRSHKSNKGRKVTKNKQPKKQPNGKKPLYKRWWFWLIVIILLIAIGGGLGGNGTKKQAQEQNTSNSSSQSSSSVQKQDSSSSSSTNNNKAKITRADFDAVKVGDLMEQGNGGLSMDEAKAKFGKPSSESSSTTQNINTNVLTWTNIDGKFGSSMILSFTDGKAFNKTLSGFKLGRKQKITLDQFNSIQNGTSYNDAIKQFGEPDGLSESLIGGNKSVTASYLTGIQGDLGANFQLTFENDALASKSQYSMK
ncbi:DUF3862 domain-containing protein [Agrilactobacillus fermenti]|uniref:DUF3862 domain-containing protein n=1 Tax=Agrilactobacillus fermenti TaxID=2586909 RepID=UPI001E3B123C|nr:DUF3862 domain-containing protein [Agrilactobacillus fermenti]MCD2257099.1 DUF3862 domain-containing protein [Agrilactobacillus fermenti]